MRLAAAAALAFAGGAGAEPVVHVRTFGATGDGRTDDAPAVRRAVEAACQRGPGTRLVFERKTYRLGPQEDGRAQIQLNGVTGLTIEGSGATLRLHPHNGVASIVQCRNVVLRGFVIDFDPLPFTQGTLRTVDAGAGSFDLELHEGYPLPPPDAAVKQTLGAGGWQWGSVMDPRERHRRWDVADHFGIESVRGVAGRTLRIQVIPPHAARLAPVRPGDRFFLPLQLTEDGRRAIGENIAVRESSDCTLEDLTIHSSRCGMNFSINRNEGRITLRNCRIAFKPDSTRIVTTWKDGVHAKDNRVGPLIEGCYFEGMLDDSINLSANTAMATAIVSPTTFVLTGPAFAAGDRVMVFDPVTGRIQTTQVREAAAQGREYRVTLADPVEGVVTGRKQLEHIKSTHFYNMSYANDGFIVRHCTFKPQRRHALLVRCSNGVFEGNTVDGVGGAAVWMGNEMGHFYEGPFPTQNVIRHNTIRNTQATAIHIYTQTAGGRASHTRDIRVEGNTITVRPGRIGIAVRNAAGVTLDGNRILDQGGKEIGRDGVSLSP